MVYEIDITYIHIASIDISAICRTNSCIFPQSRADCVSCLSERLMSERGGTIKLANRADTTTEYRIL